MKIITLVANTSEKEECIAEHGLSIYIETEKHKLLLDTGQTDAVVRNAETLGIDLTAVDTVILSHGHYDHSGGIMAFAKINSNARIYMQETADADYYADDGERAEGERYRYIGIDKAIAGLTQVVKIRGDHRIDDELDLFTIEKRSHDLPFTNKRLLMKENGELRRDDFVHEQYLVISEGDKKILISGCAHNGILSILDAFIEKYGAEPDMVISGFHLMKKTEYSDDELRQIISIGTELMRYSTKFVTCHCTGETAYEIMKNVLGDQLQYVHSGESVEVKDWR